MDLGIPSLSIQEKGGRDDDDGGGCCGEDLLLKKHLNPYDLVKFRLTNN